MGVSLDLAEPIDVFQLDEEGEPTTERIAMAEAQEDGSRKVTLVERGDEPELEGQYVTTLRAGAKLPVELGASLLSEEVSDLEWTLQSGETPDVCQTAKLALPAIGDVTDALGLAPSVESMTEEGDTTPEDEPIAQSISSGEVAADKCPENALETSGSTEAKLTSRWADNNNASGKRPGLDDVRGDYRLQFTIGGETCDFPDDAAEQLGMSEDEIKAISLDASEQGGAYIASASGLPATLTKTTWSAKTDDSGNQLWGEDEDGAHHPLWTSVTETMDVAWSVDDTNDYAEHDYQCSTDQTDKTVQYLQLREDSTYTITGKVGNEEFDKVVKNALKESEQSKNHNGYWMSVLTSYYQMGIDLNDPKNYEEIMQSLTPKDVQDFTKRFFKNADVLDLILAPDSAKK